jgi:glycine cleavage system aminomethyltransferase T
VGAEVRADGSAVGTVTSSARSQDLGPIALAPLARSVEPGTTVEVDGPGGVLTAEVRELPLR